MIVDPDFFDHFKTRLVVDLLEGDELAPLYIMRIWAHCQTRRKADDIVITAAGLRALCRCTSAPAEALEAALIEAGFIERNGESIRVVDWAVRNAKLVKAWTNGAEGGKTKAANAAKRKAEAAANANQSATEPLPNGYPTASETLPNDYPTATDALPIRSRSRSRSREEQEQNQDQKQKPARAAPPATDARRLLQAEGVDDQTAADWIAHRKAKRATASATVIEDRKRVCAEAGVPLAAGLALEVSRGWQGLKAEWIANALERQSAGRGLPFQTTQDRARGWAEIATGANHDDRNIIDITPTAARQLG